VGSSLDRAICSKYTAWIGLGIMKKHLQEVTVQQNRKGALACHDPRGEHIWTDRTLITS